MKLALRYLLVVAIFQLATDRAQACLFTRNVQPERWYDWASALFSGEVTKVEQDREKSLDIVTVRVVETFKGPAGDMATVQIPTRLRTASHARPCVGRVALGHPSAMPGGGGSDGSRARSAAAIRNRGPPRHLVESG